MFVPVLSHFCLTGDEVLAYDDSIAISIKHPLPVACAVPADLLLRLLNSLSAEAMTLALEGGHLKVACGKSNLKVPALGPDAFIFKSEFGKRRAQFVVTETLVKGIDSCLVSVGIDPTHPAQMGVTLLGGDTCALYSTDNVTMSRYVLDDEELPDVQAILPTEFCKQLVSLFDKTPEGSKITMSLHDGHAVVRFGDWAMLYTKLINDSKPLDYEKTFESMMSKAAKAKPLPDGWDAAFGRASAVVNPSHPVAAVSAEDGEVRVTATSQYGESEDTLEVEGVATAKEFLVDPAHVTRATKLCSSFAFYPRCLVMKKDVFTHLISHCTE